MNKAVFVTGATVGSGYAIADKFASEGYNVVVTSRSDERAKKAAKEISENTA